MDFLDFIRKVAQERKERGYIIKGGPGSGWFAPPKGTHGKGTRAEVKGFGGTVSFSEHKAYGKRGKKPLGTAHFGGDITFDKEQYSGMDRNARHFSIAHEVVHHTVEEHVLRDQKEWDQAEKVLAIATAKGGRKLFVGGNTRIGEAVSDAIAGVMVNNRFGGISDEKWNDVKRWAKGVTHRAGYNMDKLKSDVEYWHKELDKQL